MTKHKIKSKMIPAFVMLSPVSIWLFILVALPLLYILVMSFCSIDDYYNVIYKFTGANYKNLFHLDYVKIYLLVLKLKTF